jgi:dTDP-4-dehydrorhamnose 3,5-epimerase
MHPLDPDLGIEWPASAPTLSEKDASAPTPAEAALSGLLPDYGAHLTLTSWLGSAARTG